MPRISALPAVVGNPGSTDLFVCVQGSITKRIPFSQIASSFTVGPLSITSTELADGSVTENKLLSSPTNDAIRAVTTNHIRDLNVTSSKLADGSVIPSKIPTGSIPISKLVPNTLSITDFNPTDREKLSKTGQVRLGTTVVSSGYVKKIVVVSGGSYGSTPTVTISPPPAGGVTATATAVLTSGAVTSILVTNPGSGYVSTPTVSFSPLGASAYAYTLINGLLSSNASGPNCSLFITTDEKIKVIGNSVSGQLGTGTASADDLVLPQEPNFNSSSTNLPTPVLIYGASSSSYVVCSDGSVWSTGENAAGQLGLGDTTDRTVFHQIPQSYFANKPIIKLAVATLGTTSGVGTSVFGLAADGTLFAWGLNGYGQLGLGNFANQLFPAAVPGTGTGGDIVRDVVTGGTATFICSAYLTATGEVKAAGFTRQGAMARGGGIGSPYRQTSFLPWLIGPSTPVTNVKKILITSDGATNVGPTIAALTNAGVVWVAGAGNRGQLGNGGLASTLSGYANSPASGITDLFCPPGYDPCFIATTPATASTGGLRVWGYNNTGQLGLNTAANLPTVSVSGPNNVNFSKVVISSQGSLFSYALATDGRIFAAGYNNQGALGNGTLGLTSIKSWNQVLLGRSDIVDISISGTGTNATPEVLTSDGKVYKCGNNQAGQLGRGTIVPASSRNMSNVLF